MRQNNNSSGCGCLILIGLAILLIKNPILIVIGFAALFALVVIAKQTLFNINFGNPRRYNNGEYSHQFLDYLFSSLGKLAKADGVVCQSEARQINDFIRQLGLSTEEKEVVSNSFKAACENSVTYQFYIDKLAELVGHNPNQLQLILSLYCSIAISDGTLSPAEEEFIDYAESRFNLRGYSRAFFGRGGQSQQT